MNDLKMISINSLNLSVRATNVLLALNVQNAYDLVQLDFIHILKAKNCGVKTASEIETATRRFVRETESESKAPLKMAPIFGSDSEEISSLDLETLNWYEIEALPLNARAANVIKELKLKSIYELVQLDAARLLKRKNCGKKTIEEIRRALKNFILTQACGNEKGEIKKLQDCLDYLKALLLSPNNETILKQDRYKKVFIGRVGIGCRISTLEQIGRELSLTRERVRQIAKKVATICFNAMDYSTKKFFKEFTKSICDNGGLLALEKSELYTASSDEIKLFNFLLESRYGKVQFHSRLGIWSAVGARKFELLCDKISAAFKKCCPPGKIYGLTDIKDISSRLSGELGIGCCDVEPVVRIAINDCFKLHGDGNYLFSRQAHNLGAIYEAVIRDFFPQGIAIYKDYTAFFDALAKFSPKIAKEMESNKHAMIVRATSAGNTVLWDWGVYIHKDNIHIDEKILQRTKKWILDQFGKGRDKISLWGAFSENEDAYLKVGIKNQYALYSCMKLKFPNEFAFLEAPYVQPKRSTKRISRSEMLEKYLKQKNGPVEIEQISRDLGLKEYQICQSFYYDEELNKKILPWGSWTYIHINNVSIEEQDLKEVLKFVNATVTKHGHVNIKHAYDAKIVLCKKNDIPSPRALYAILKLNSTDGLYFPGFPHVMVEELAAVHNGRFSLNDIVEHFLSSKNQVFSYEELYDYFVKQRGYSQQTVDNLPFFCSNIVSYTTGSYIALDTIEWTEEKSKSLERIATDKFKEDGDLLGRPFSHVDDLLELDLPKINKKIDVPWQKTLLCELLEKIDNIKILGTYGDVFVVSPNKFNIETLEDLVEFVLKTEFSGAANVNALESKLSELRITKTLGSATESNVGYKVEGEEVFILRGQS